MPNENDVNNIISDAKAELISEPNQSNRYKIVLPEEPSRKKANQSIQRIFYVETDHSTLLGQGGSTGYDPSSTQLKGGVFLSTYFKLNMGENTILDMNESKAKYVIKIYDENSDKVRKMALKEKDLISLIPRLKKNGTDEKKNKAWVVDLPLHKKEDDKEEYLPAVIQPREEGIELFKLWKEHKEYPLTLQQRAQLTLNIVDELKRVHKCGILHLDLKLANMMVNPETLAVKIIDLSFSMIEGGKYHREVEGEPEYGGTLKYVPPEQLNCKPVDRRSDGYSLIKAVIAPLWDIYPSEWNESDAGKVIGYLLKDTVFSLPINALELQKEIKQFSERVCKAKAEERLSPQDFREELLKLPSFKAALEGKLDLKALAEEAELLQTTPLAHRKPSSTHSNKGLMTFSLFKRDMQNVSKQSGQTPRSCLPCAVI